MTQVPRIMELAQQLEEDIAHRKLKPGDPYLTLAEASKMLGVNTATTNRAMQLLAQRKVLIRVQRKAPIIGSLQREPSPGRLRRVYMLVHRGYLRQEGLFADRVLVGMQGELTGADIQFNFLPDTDPTEYINNLISTVLRGKEPAGLVMTKAPFIVQRLVEASGLPAVVHGSLYPSIRRLSWIDQDHRQLAEIMVNFVLQRHCTHVCALTRDVIFPGDNFLLADVARRLGEAGLKCDAFEIAHLPEDLEAVETEVARLITLHPEGLGLLCRSEMKAQAALRAIKRMRLKPSRRPTLLVSGLFHRPEENRESIPHVFAKFEPEDIGAAIGRLLARQAVEPNLPPESVSIPLELYGR